MTVGESNYDVTESECPACEDGTLLVNSFELVCDTCDNVTRKGGGRRVSGQPKEAIGQPRSAIARDDAFVEYLRDRGTTDSGTYRYNNSDTVIMPGGFEDAYHGNGIYGEGNGPADVADVGGG